MDFIRDAWYRKRGTEVFATLDSWGEKNVKLGLGPKMPAPRRMTRTEFERDWAVTSRGIRPSFYILRNELVGAVLFRVQTVSPTVTVNVLRLVCWPSPTRTTIG
jgi:hypothetical protein